MGRPRKQRPVPTRATPATVADVLAALPHLGPWRLVGPLRMVRNAAGDCPLIAFARSRGKVSPNSQPDSGRSVARQIGLSEADGDDLADAADGIGPSYARVGLDDDAARVNALRVKLLAACGLKEVPRLKRVTDIDPLLESNQPQGGSEECPRRSA